jgi:hypothetical protein
MLLDNMDVEDTFAALSDWIIKYLKSTDNETDPYHSFDGYYSRFSDFWCTLPQIMWALNWRTYDKSPMNDACVLIIW